MCVRKDFEHTTLVDRRRKELPLDTLAVVTGHQRRLVEAVYVAANDLQKLPAVKVVLHSSQPAHAVAVAAVLLVCSLPQLSPKQPISAGHGLVTNIAYLASFSVHLGNQFWMTFVSGLVLYFNLPRHHFGAVQKVLFPKYFSINSFLSLIALISFIKMHHITSIETPEIIQVVVLSGCFLLELMIRLYIVPPVIQMITAKTQLEVSAGVGGEVGYWDPGPLLRCPHYHRLHTQFRKQHLVVAAGNMLTMACTSIHLYYLASHRG